MRKKPVKHRYSALSEGPVLFRIEQRVDPLVPVRWLLNGASCLCLALPHQDSTIHRKAADARKKANILKLCSADFDSVVAWKRERRIAQSLFNIVYLQRGNCERQKRHVWSGWLQGAPLKRLASGRPCSWTPPLRGCVRRSLLPRPAVFFRRRPTLETYRFRRTPSNTSSSPRALPTSSERYF